VKSQLRRTAEMQIDPTAGATLSTCGNDGDAGLDAGG
jgi:hypothetical protein